MYKGTRVLKMLLNKVIKRRKRSRTYESFRKGLSQIKPSQAVAWQVQENHNLYDRSVGSPPYRIVDHSVQVSQGVTIPKPQWIRWPSLSIQFVGCADNMNDGSSS